MHRLLASLEGKGFIVRNPATEKYGLGFRVWELSANLARSDDPGTILLPEMERLRDTLGETVSLYVRDGLERDRIQAVQSNQAVRRVAPVGARLPLYVGASSKVLVAFAQREVEEQLHAAEDWPVWLAKTAYADQLVEVRKLGYAISIEEREPGAAAVSAPIFDRSHKLVAALSVSGPSNRLTGEKMREQAPLIMEYAGRNGQNARLILRTSKGRHALAHDGLSISAPVPIWRFSSFAAARFAECRHCGSTRARPGVSMRTMASNS